MDSRTLYDEKIHKPYAFFCSLVLSVKRLPNCACCSINTSNSPSLVAYRNLRIVSGTSASLASSIVHTFKKFQRLASVSTTRLILSSTLSVHQRLAISTFFCLPSSSVIHLYLVGINPLFVASLLAHQS
jgi:hypothetical protein